MSLPLGKIVKSNAHTDYVCQIYGKHEVKEVPQAAHYALGTFVSIDLGGEGAGHLVGLIYDTVLLNPDFGRLGPRLSPETELTVFTPDYLNERAVLVGISAIGWVDGAGRAYQGVPPFAATSDAQVRQMAEDQIRAFHQRVGEGDEIQVTYLPILIQQRNPLTYHLARAVLERLRVLLPAHRDTLAVLVDDLVWLTQISPMGGAS